MSKVRFYGFVVVYSTICRKISHTYVLLSSQLFEHTLNWEGGQFFFRPLDPPSPRKFEGGTVPLKELRGYIQYLPPLNPKSPFSPQIISTVPTHVFGSIWEGFLINFFCDVCFMININLFCFRIFEEFMCLIKTKGKYYLLGHLTCELFFETC